MNTRIKRLKPWNPISGFEDMEDRVRSLLLSRLSGHERLILESIGNGDVPRQLRIRFNLPAPIVAEAIRNIMIKLQLRDRQDLRQYAARIVQSQVAA